MLEAGQLVTIVGGGISGLTAAYRISQRQQAAGWPVRVQVIEAEATWGGVLRSRRRDGWVMEEGPDSFIRIKPAGLQLVRDLGLEDELIPTSEAARSSLIARGRKLVPVPEGLYLLAPGRILPFAFSPIMSWRGKLRMGLDLVLPRRPADAPEESLADFVRRRLGREALTRLAQPMVGGIYTADPERLSLAATMPQFLEMEQEYRSLLLAMRARTKQQRQAAASGPRYGLFTTLRSGLDGLITRLRTVIAEAGVTLRQESRVAALQRHQDGEAGGDGENGWHITLDNGESWTSNAVVIATPAHMAAKLLQETTPRLAADLASIPYAGVATVNVGLRAEQVPDLPQAAGFVVPAVEHRHIVACTIASCKFAERAPEGHVLLRAFVGGAPHADDLTHDDQTLAAHAVADLRTRLGIRGEPLFATVHRWEQAMAQPVLGHRERVANIRAGESQTPGLALVGNGYEGVGIPDLAAQALAAAERLLPSEVSPGGA